MPASTQTTTRIGTRRIRLSVDNLISHPCLVKQAADNSRNDNLFGVDVPGHCVTMAGLMWSAHAQIAWPTDQAPVDTSMWRPACRRETATSNARRPRPTANRATYAEPLQSACF